MELYENYTLSDFSERNFEWASVRLTEIVQKVDREIRKENRRRRIYRVLDNIENVMRGAVPAVCGMGYAVLVLLGQ